MTASIIPFKPPAPHVGNYHADPAVILVLPVVRVDRDEDDGGFQTRFYNCRCSLGPVDLEALKEP